MDTNDSPGVWTVVSRQLCMYTTHSIALVLLVAVWAGAPRWLRLLALCNALLLLMVSSAIGVVDTENGAATLQMMSTVGVRTEQAAVMAHLVVHVLPVLIAIPWAFEQPLPARAVAPLVLAAVTVAPPLVLILYSRVADLCWVYGVPGAHRALRVALPTALATYVVALLVLGSTFTNVTCR